MRRIVLTARSFDKSFTRWLSRLSGGEGALERVDEETLMRIRQRMRRVRHFEQSESDLAALEREVMYAAKEEGLFEGKGRSGWNVPPFFSGALAATAVWLLVLAVTPGPVFFERDPMAPKSTDFVQKPRGTATVDRSLQIELGPESETTLNDFSGQLASIGYVRILEISSGGTAKLVFLSDEENLKSFSEFMSGFDHAVEEPGIYVLEVRR